MKDLLTLISEEREYLSTRVSALCDVRDAVQTQITEIAERQRALQQLQLDTLTERVNNE